MATSMTNEAESSLHDYPSRIRAWSMVGLLVLVAVIATLDRGILSLVIDPVRHALAISDFQVSLLQGLSFSLFYATIGLLLGLGADRVRRVRLLTLGIVFWSLATIAAGLSTGFGSMFMSRLVVGMGEATLGPCCISLICDLFQPLQRGRPMGLFIMGQAVASGLSVMLTGSILRHLPHGLLIDLPQRFSTPVSLEAWRVAFIITGLLGLLIVPLLLAAPEPRRMESVSTSQRKSAAQSLRLLSARSKILTPLLFGFASMSAGFYATLAWGAVSITRRFSIQTVQVSPILGSFSVVFGIVGPLLAGMLADRVMRQTGSRSRLRLLLIMPLLTVPTMLAPFAPAMPVSAVCIAFMMVAYPATSTVFFSVLQGVVPNEVRGFTIALCGFINAVIGATCGPLFLAFLTAHGYAGQAATAFSLSTTLLLTTTLGLLLFFAASMSNSNEARTPVPVEA